MKGKVIVISGPSGVGKHTLFKKIMENSGLNLSYSVSMTTRKSRPGEIDGIDYYFCNNEQFDSAIENNELIEWAEFSGNKYGTPKKKLIDQINNGKNVILEIETIGAKNIFNIFKQSDLISIFVLPPCFDELKNRLKNRGTENIDVINKRLERAKFEIDEQKYYQYKVVNDDIDNASNQIIEIIKKNIN